MTSVASETWGLVFWRQGAAAFAAATGPETRAGSAPVPDEADFVGIQFAVGTSLRIAPASSLVDSGIELPVASRSRFWLGADRWAMPAADEAEQFVARLVAVGALVRDSLVQEVLDGRPFHGTRRTLERRFRAATGLTRGAIGQIERARAATDLLGAGCATIEVVERLGFYDEPHLARSLRRYVGRTATQLREGRGGALALADLTLDAVDGLDDAVRVRRGVS